MIAGIQRTAKNCVGVIALTDCDLFTANLSNYCFGYGIPAYGGVQSIARFLPEWTDEKYNSAEELEDAILMRLCKIGAHELGHMFGMGHCIHY